MQTRRWLLPLLAALAGCGGQTPGPAAAPAPAPDPGLTWRADPVLARVLAVPTLGRRELILSDTLASLDAEFDLKLGRLLAEGTAPPLIRTNAILLLGDRRVPGIVPYLNALADPDERVRAAAVVALKNNLSGSRDLEGLVKAALADRSTLVQAKALEALADLDVPTLRAYLARTTDPTLRQIATDLVIAAENRGGPLMPDSMGRFQHTGPAGRTLIYRPTARWPAWESSAGELFVTSGRDTTRVSANVETVGNVVPAFFSIDGRYLVYEAARAIHVRDLQTGSDRSVGAGIAPRLLPFSASYVYLRPKGQPVTSGVNTSLKYEVIRGWFAEPREQVLGEVTMSASYQRRGYYSPARWLRIRESDGAFFLFGESMELFRLPDPFTEK